MNALKWKLINDQFNDRFKEQKGYKEKQQPNVASSVHKIEQFPKRGRFAALISREQKINTHFCRSFFEIRAGTGKRDYEPKANERGKKDT